MENLDLRLKARGANVPLWRIAKELGISEPTMTRRLRTPLSEAEKQQITSIIDRIAKEIR